MSGNPAAAGVASSKVLRSGSCLSEWAEATRFNFISPRWPAFPAHSLTWTLSSPWSLKPLGHAGERLQNS